MLSGAPTDQWNWSVVLRRVLYPLLAFPLMSIFGFLAGGFLTNVVLHLLSFVLLVKHIEKRIGHRGAIPSAWVFATYPGIAYWVGLPYSYAIIVPGTILLYVVLHTLWESSTSLRTTACCLGIGIVSTGYDFLPFFGLAAIFLICIKTQWMALIPSAAALLAPSVLVSATLNALYDIPFTNSNTASYLNIFNSYLTLPSWDSYRPILMALPGIAWSNLMFGNFLALPLLGILGLLLLYRPSAGGLKWSSVDGALLLSIVLVFLFNNMAPPYQGWQLRGDWIARVYQPLFIFYLATIARASESSSPGSWRSRLIYTAVIVTIIVQSATVYGPAFRAPIVADYLYSRFYAHDGEGNVTMNLARYGRRPLGICKNRIGW
jgi:hypothetical protein